MAHWFERAEQLTYDGEEITETVEMGAGGVVVTTHRVLVFSPSGDGDAFSHVERPNVTGVEATEAGEGRYLSLAAQAGGVGLLLVLAGALLPIDSMIGNPEIDGAASGQIGIGDAVGMMESLIGLLRSLDTALLVLGMLAAVLGLGAFGLYLQTREHELWIERAGDDPLTLALGDDEVSESAVQRLRRAIEPDK